MTANVKGLLRLLLYAAVGLLPVVGVYLAWSGPDPMEARPAELPRGWSFSSKPDYVLAMAAHDDVVWAGTRDGLFVLDAPSARVVRAIEADVPLRHVRALLVDRSGHTWAGHDMGLTCIKGRTVTTFDQRHGLPERVVNALARVGRSRMLVGTSNGAVVWDLEQNRVVRTVDGLLNPMVNCVLVPGDGSWWFGSYGFPDGGITIVRDTVRQHIAISDGLPHPYVTAMARGGDGAVWVGCGFGEDGGLCRFERREGQWQLIRVLGTDDGLPGNKVRSLCADDDGALWVGTEYDGLGRYDGRTWTTYGRVLAHPEVLSILQDTGGRMWFGTQPGITRLVSDEGVVE